MKQILIVTVITFNLTSMAHADERAKSKNWCTTQNGKQETLYDGTRPDCSFDNFVVEVEHLNKSSKVYDSIGQALHYSTVTQKTPIIVYYFNKPEHKKYLQRIEDAIKYNSLDIYLCDLNKACTILKTGNALAKNNVQETKPINIYSKTISDTHQTEKNTYSAQEINNTFSEETTKKQSYLPASKILEINKK